jgi:CHASE2 domain-containing sensor protein
VYLRLRGGAPVSGEVALLTIGPEALYLYDPDDPAPETTPRALLAELVRFLDAADASVIALDFLLDRPAEGDEALARAAEAHGAVIAAERFTITEPAARRAFTPGIPPALELVMGSGLANFQEETAGLWGDELVVRRIPLVHGTDRAHLTGAWPHNQLGAKQDIDQVVPSLALAAAWAHRERQAGRPGRTDGLVRELALGCTARPLGCDLAEGVLGLDLGAVDLSAPTDINFRGPETGDGLVTVDAARVLRVLAQAALMRELGADAAIEVPPDLRARLEGRVVVVGRVSPEGGDRFLTPYSMPFGATPDMSGPRIHAHVIDTLLSGRHVRRASGLWMWALAAATALAVSATYGRTRDTIHAVAWLLGTVGLLFLGFAVFRATDGLVLDLGPAVAGVLLPLTWLHLRGWVREQAGLAL